MRRTLRLRSEALTELGSTDLAAVVAAGTHTVCYTGITYCEICDAIVINPPPTYTCTT